LDHGAKDDAFLLEEEKILSEIRRRRCLKVLFQAPEGLRNEALHLAKLVEEKLSVETFVSANPCFGACNVALSEKSFLGADLIVHLGHARIPGIGNEDVLYIEAKSSATILPVLERAKPLMKGFEKIGLITNVQHIHRLREAREFLEREGKKVLIGDPKGRLIYPGQVLGCDYSTVDAIEARVDAFLYIGGGTFHPLGASLRTSKPVIAADPITLEVRCMESLKRQLLRKRYAQIIKAKRARSFGIIIGLEPGQTNPDIAEDLRRRLKARGFEVFRISVNILFPNALRDFQEIEAFVNTACPRISFEAPDSFEKPLLTPEETLILLGEKTWDEYVKEAD
jgi:2-(3-amino-3-carboxypropyl)histidine synthase